MKPEDFHEKLMESIRSVEPVDEHHRKRLKAMQRIFESTNQVFVEALDNIRQEQVALRTNVRPLDPPPAWDDFAEVCNQLGAQAPVLNEIALQLQNRKRT